MNRVVLSRAATYLPLLVAVFLIVLKLQPIDGKMGHDYFHFFVRLYLGDLHFWQNGLAVPHYTPLLSGGIPFFADPQAVYYSLPQFLTFYLEPLIAIDITVAAFTAFGYFGFLKLTRSLGGGPLVAHLAALAFVLNGYSFAQLFVGHFTHHSYLLFPWVLYAFWTFAPTRTILLKRVALFSLVISYAFYSGGMHVLVIFAVALLFSLPYLAHYRWKRGALAQTLAFIGLSSLCIALTCSGKFVASLLYSKSFYTEGIDSSPLTPVSLALQYFWFDPATTPHFLKFGRWTFGPWEYVGFVSKATIPFFIAFPFLILKSRGKRLILGLLPYSIFTLLIFSVAAGTELNTLLPFFRHYHNPVKILSALIPFLILAMAFGLSALERWKRIPDAGFLVLAALLLVEFVGYSNFFLKTEQPTYFPHQPSFYTLLKRRGRIEPIKRVEDQPLLEMVGLVSGLTTLKSIEPLFGYRAEAVKTKLVVGPTSLIREGSFNLNHPGCFIYSSYFHCEPWDRIPDNDKINFEKFTQGKNDAWGVPRWQELLLWVNALALLSIFAFLTLFSLEWGTGRRRRFLARLDFPPRRSLRAVA